MGPDTAVTYVRGNQNSHLSAPLHLGLTKSRVCDLREKSVDARLFIDRLAPDVSSSVSGYENRVPLGLTSGEGAEGYPRE